MSIKIDFIMKVIFANSYEELKQFYELAQLPPYENITAAPLYIGAKQKSN